MRARSRVKRLSPAAVPGRHVQTCSRLPTYPRRPSSGSAADACLQAAGLGAVRVAPENPPDADRAATRNEAGGA